MSSVAEMRRFRPARWGLWLLAAAMLVPAGCNRNRLGRMAISGKVSFQGKPLDKGTIDFRPVAGNNSVSSGAVITDGAYEIAAAQGLPPGKYEVRIYSSREDTSPLPPGVPPGAMRPGIDRIGPDFNIHTKLTADVAAVGPNQFDFDIP